MKKTLRKDDHPLLPSGKWEGFYVYQQRPDSDQHKMSMQLDFTNGIVSGYGSDDVSGYSWRGTYDLKTMRCNLTKAYNSHKVDYEGSIDENGIWGTWTLDSWKGGFHIWPKKGAAKQEEKKAVSDRLAEAEKVVIRRIDKAKKAKK